MTIRHAVTFKTMFLVTLAAAAPAMRADTHPPKVSDNPAPVAAVAAAPGVIRAKGPTLIRMRSVGYPEIARQANASGMVRVMILVGTDGRVREAHAISGPLLLRGFAENAIRYWRYAPAVADKRPVEVVTYATLNFQL